MSVCLSGGVGLADNHADFLYLFIGWLYLFIRMYFLLLFFRCLIKNNDELSGEGGGGWGERGYLPDSERV